MPEMHSSSSSLQVRQATAADAPVIAHHRARMFEDMGVISGDVVRAMLEASTEYFAAAVASGEYVGFFAFDAAAPEHIAAGAGLLLRTIPPFPNVRGRNAGTMGKGQQGLVINVYAEPAWRRKGLARMLMREVMQFAERAGVENLVLHASSEGRSLYEQLGFQATNEMRLVQR